MKALLLALVLAAPARATVAPPTYGFVQEGSTGSGVLHVTGKIKVKATAATADTAVITLDGATGNVTATVFTGSAAGLTGITATSTSVAAGSITGGPLASTILPSTVAFTSVANTFSNPSGNTFTYGLHAGSGTFDAGVTATSGTFSASGNSQYSIVTSSGINVIGGVVKAPAFVGNGSALTNIIVAGVIDTNKLATDAVTGSAILNGSVTQTKTSGLMCNPGTGSQSLLCNPNGGSTATSTLSTAVGGTCNAQNTGATCVGGDTNNSTGLDSLTVGGHLLVASNTNAACLGGSDNQSTAISATTVGGSGLRATAQNTYAMGVNATASGTGGFIYSSNTTGVAAANAIQNATYWWSSAGFLVRSGSFTVVNDAGAVLFSVDASSANFTVPVNFVPIQKTAAQAHAITPSLGQIIQCTNCTRPYTICVGTNTVADGWREQGEATGCY